MSKNFKFNVGDVLKRTDSPITELFTVKEIVKEVSPFHTQLWYVGVDRRGVTCQGLKTIIEKCYTKIN